MNKQKWMTLGAAAVVCAAWLAPGAFAKESDESYVAPSSVMGIAYEQKETPLPNCGPAGIFLIPENENSKK
ncbi:hypothetical protein [Brevibacillus brevis]|uniref:Secreted protein n=1 Tax=Brevibacillus brevis TaxID=1393 RepID=A0ABY9T8T2_BREBE|nr:hypothetical protein [Brevibacillus brevis]WNC16515.1 hypothetical protein RGB73_09400 [Brevibacillus brevis]